MTVIEAEHHFHEMMHEGIARLLRIIDMQSEQLIETLKEEGADADKRVAAYCIAHGITAMRSHLDRKMLELLDKLGEIKW